MYYVFYLINYCYMPQVDRLWKKTLAQAKATPHLLSTCASARLLEQFQDCNKQLESVQKGLADYLETKRLAFARFFFLSNDELLQILSQVGLRGDVQLAVVWSACVHGWMRDVFHSPDESIWNPHFEGS